MDTEIKLVHLKISLNASYATGSSLALFGIVTTEKA